jgi:hypothetical protein
MGVYQMGLYQMGVYQMGLYQMGTFDQYPLSQIGYTGLAGDNIGAADINLTELGLGAIVGENGENLQVVGFSANRGPEKEVVLTFNNVADTRLFVAVVGANGAHSTAPYLLQIEASTPLDTSEALSSAGFSYDTPVTDWSTSTETVLLHDYDDPETIDNDEAKTLFVTQQERLIGRYGQGDWDALLAKLIEVAQHDSVRGDIISVPIDIYETWDNNTFSVDAANEVAAQIRAEIETRLNTDIEYVVLVGNDDIITHRRVLDKTVTGNERLYAMSSFLKPGSPLFSITVTCSTCQHRSNPSIYLTLRLPGW